MGPLQDGTRLFGRHYRFFQELYAFEPARSWTEIKTDVFSLHREYDWVSAGRDHRTIAQLSDPHGRSRYLEIPQMDHWMTRHPDEQSSLANWARGQLTSEIADVTIDWMREILMDD